MSDPVPLSAADSAVARAHVELAISEFHAEWQRAWKLTERQRSHFGDRTLAMVRSPYLHCHAKVAATFITAARLRRQGIRQIPTVGNERSWEYVVARDTTFAQFGSTESAFGVCPTWLLHPIQDGKDESAHRDGALMVLMQEYIRDRRRKVLVLLDSTSQLLPGDGWLSGQRVRFHVDQQNWQQAIDAARSCRANRWWCLALEGYATGRQGAVHHADSTFARMRASMEPQLRCRWTDVGDLLPQHEQEEYRPLDCASREVVQDRLWWLADPLYRHVGNDRLVEQEMRRVEILLRQATTHDERYAWYAERGGDAFPQMIRRYGWPSYTAWGGAREDVGHTSWLDIHFSPSAAPYTTFEYTLGRIRALPGWPAVVSPFEAVETDWMLASENVAGEPSPTWWPVEHFNPRRRLVQLPEGQTAFFRRQSTVLVATALRLRHPVIAAENSFDVLMLTSPAPHRVDSVAQAIARGGAKVVLRGASDTLPAIMSIEASGRSLDARSRFGVVPPATLAAMRAGEIAISDPVLLEPAQGQSAMVAGDDELNAMLPSSELAADERAIRIFWESYGLAAGDSVRISVRVTRDVTVGRLRRIGIALNIATDPNNSVQVQWTEPNPQRATRSLVGPVPVQMRLLALNLSELVPGPYVLEISMQRPGGPIAQSQRRFSIIP